MLKAISPPTPINNPAPIFLIISRSFLVPFTLFSCILNQTANTKVPKTAKSERKIPVCDYIIKAITPRMKVLDSPDSFF